MTRLRKFVTEAIVIRNICGHVPAGLNDIIGLDGFATFREMMIIHHTGQYLHPGETMRSLGYSSIINGLSASDCGALHFTNSYIHELLRQRAPTTENIESMSFGAITK